MVTVTTTATITSSVIVVTITTGVTTTIVGVVTFVVCDIVVGVGGVPRWYCVVGVGGCGVCVCVLVDVSALFVSVSPVVLVCGGGCVMGCVGDVGVAVLGCGGS